MVQNNGNASVKLERENVDKVGVVPCPADRGQQHEIAPQQIVEQKPHYTVNPLDELNESPVDGFGQIEENAFDEEGDEIMADNSMEMDGIRERFSNMLYMFYITKFAEWTTFMVIIYRPTKVQATLVPMM
jgi:hypothetical protein